METIYSQYNNMKISSI